MSVTIAPLQNPPTPFQGVDNSQKIVRVYFSLTPSNAPSAYPGAPGDPINFSTLGDLIKSGYAPLIVVLIAQDTGGSSGYTYYYVPGSSSNVASGFLQVLQGGAAVSSPQADIGAGNYPAAVLADTIIGYADFVRL